MKCLSGAKGLKIIIAVMPMPDARGDMTAVSGAIQPPGVFKQGVPCCNPANPV